jgi:hypothetical protein
MTDLHKREALPPTVHMTNIIANVALKSPRQPLFGPNPPDFSTQTKASPHLCLPVHRYCVTIIFPIWMRRCSHPSLQPAKQSLAMISSSPLFVESLLRSSKQFILTSRPAAPEPKTEHRRIGVKSIPDLNRISRLRSPGFFGSH